MYYSTKEVAKMLGCSDETVRVKIRSGKLRAVKLGERLRVNEQDLFKMIRESNSSVTLTDDEIKKMCQICVKF